jgi:hypothetical protein
VHDRRAAGDANALTELLVAATERMVLAQAPGKSGATLERVVIGGQDYVLKHLDLAQDWTMRASGCLRGAPLMLWERGILSRLPECFNLNATVSPFKRSRPGGPEKPSRPGGRL